MKTIVITGTPGTGKTTLAKKLSKRSGYKYIDVAKLVKGNKLEEGYDKKRKCKIVDVKKLNIALIKIIKNSEKPLIIDSHLSHYLPKKYVDLCIVTKCDLKALEKRLKKKGYDKNKMRENLDCEIFDVCYNEAAERKHRVLIIDTSKEINLKNIIKKER